MSRTDSIQIAGYWLELKCAWEKWQRGEHMPTLSPAAQQYFEEISMAYFSRAAKALGRVYENVPPVRTGLEAWSHVFHHLVEKRRFAAMRVLDDIFLTARLRCNTPPGMGAQEELEHQLGCILKQFQMRVRDVVRTYAAEHGTHKEAATTEALHQPLAGQPESALIDIVAFLDPNWATAPERDELRVAGTGIATRFFPGVRTPFKLSLYVRMLRIQRGLIITGKNEILLALAGVGPPVFAQGAVNALDQFAAEVALEPAYQELDREGQFHFLGYATLSIAERAELWMHLGESVAEFLETHASTKGGPRVTPCDVVNRLEAFAQLLHQRMMADGVLLSENELQPLFQAIEKARQQHCRHQPTPLS